ncbi:hypothetical protein EJ05DRAFT_497306 [Pseudovirgaria hyperparasitica]|uniref:Uncharacterized protein n=1 Tax=Pseudovirgaria hyperparasitica TaxID=470096 RepID=A0A6A6WF04_9PEZI|nr:uncharacterized protein EJ05DRAFT_497306 [Pseudovirgaria hyperparasitica]KAF2760739.1 hypothetical protein EJ05DRAFT_497306 [Pseudovirgaria hyperparasitica]
MPQMRMDNLPARNKHFRAIKARLRRYIEPYLSQYSPTKEPQSNMREDWRFEFDRPAYDFAYLCKLQPDKSNHDDQSKRAVLQSRSWNIVLGSPQKPACLSSRLCSNETIECVPVRQKRQKPSEDPSSWKPAVFFEGPEEAVECLVDRWTSYSGPCSDAGGLNLQPRTFRLPDALDFPK